MKPPSKNVSHPATKKAASPRPPAKSAAKPGSKAPPVRVAAPQKPTLSNKSSPKAAAPVRPGHPAASVSKVSAAGQHAKGSAPKSAPVRAAAHPTKAPPTAKAAPKGFELAPSVLQAQAAARTAGAGNSPQTAGAGNATAVPADADKGKGSKKPKPPAKTMKVPAPMPDILVKREIPDVRRIASAALLSDTARGIAPPSQTPKAKETDHDDAPRMDASLIATSLAADAHPKIEDNYDYSVLEEMATSQWCPSPTRMVNTGCSGGEAAVYFAKRGFNGVGIDADRMAVGLARERAWLGGVEIDFMVGDLFETPNLLPAESFGLAIDRGAFYKLTDDRDRQRYLANIRRLLFQGGIAYISAGFFPLPEGYEKPRATKKVSPKVLLVREGGVVVNEVRQAGFDPVHRVLRPTADSGEYGELFLYLRK